MPKSKKLTRPQLHGRIRALERHVTSNDKRWLEQQQRLHRLHGRAAQFEWTVRATLDVLGAYSGDKIGMLRHGLENALWSTDKSYPLEESDTAMCATSSCDEEPMKGVPPA